MNRDTDHPNEVLEPTARVDVEEPPEIVEPEVEPAPPEEPAIEAPPAAAVETEPSPAAEEPQPVEFPVPAEVRAGNVVVEGVLTGIRNYALRPVPATGYAARRLRARTFRVAALGELMAHRVAERLRLRVLVSTGGRFLLAGPAEHGWEETLHGLQREFDAWLFQHLHPPGFLQCLLAGAVCTDGRLPVPQLELVRAHLRLQPMEGALRVGVRWNGRAFVAPAGPHIGICSGCAAVIQVRLFGDEKLCESCAAESEAGELLGGATAAWIVSEQESDVPGPGLGLRFAQPGAGGTELRLDAGAWPLFRRLPARTFEEIAERAAGGTRMLGFLRLNVDRLGDTFDSFQGDASRYFALSFRIHDFFGRALDALLAESFPHVYPVYAGGDDLVLIGAWQETLEAAVRLQREFAATAAKGGAQAVSLSLSAGLALAPVNALLSGATAEAGDHLAAARAAGGGAIHALGVTVPWSNAEALLRQAHRITEWVERRALTTRWLRRVAQLHAIGNNGSLRARSELRALLREPRVRQRQAREWLSRLAAESAGPAGPAGTHPQGEWPWLPFLCRYALLAARPGTPAAELAQPAAEPAASAAESKFEPALEE